MEYLGGTLPSRNTPEQNGQMVGNILKELTSEGKIQSIKQRWYDLKTE